MFGSMMDLVVEMLGPDLGPLTETLRELGARHLKYGVSSKHYPVIGEAIANSLTEFLGVKGFDLECWMNLYRYISLTMIEGAHEARKRYEKRHSPRRRRKSVDCGTRSEASPSLSPTLEKRGSNHSSRRRLHKMPAKDNHNDPADFSPTFSPPEKKSSCHSSRHRRREMPIKEIYCEPLEKGSSHHLPRLRRRNTLTKDESRPPLSPTLKSPLEKRSKYFPLEMLKKVNYEPTETSSDSPTEASSVSPKSRDDFFVKKAVLSPRRKKFQTLLMTGELLSLDGDGNQCSKAESTPERPRRGYMKKLRSFRVRKPPLPRTNSERLARI